MPNSRLISLLIGLGMLGACGESEKRARDAQNDNGADFALTLDGNEGSANVSVDLPVIQGKFRLPALKIGTDVDIEGVKLYPGTKVTGIDIAGEEGHSDGSLAIRFLSDAAPAALRRYYLDAFKEKGMAVTSSAYSISGRGENGKPFRIDLEPQDDGSGTSGTIRFGARAR